MLQNLYRTVLVACGIFLGCSSSLWACGVCFGESSSASAKGLAMGVMTLLVILLFVLGGFAKFFLALRKRLREVS